MNALELVVLGVCSLVLTLLGRWLYRDWRWQQHLSRPPVRAVTNGKVPIQLHGPRPAWDLAMHDDSRVLWLRRRSQAQVAAFCLVGCALLVLAAWVAR